MPLNVGDFLASAVSPDEVDTFSLMGYDPTLRQQEFHIASWDRVDRIFYGGSVGGGKSLAALMDAIRFAANYPKIRIGMHRKSYPELEKSFIRELAKWDFAKKLAPLWNGIPPRWNKTAKILSFPNGSVIEFMYAETVADVTKIQGGEYQVFYFDEAALNDPRVVQQIEERLRSGSRIIPVIGARYASNPGGQAHQYFKDNFIKPTDYGRHPYKYTPEGSEQSLTHIFIPAKLSDNPYVNPEYINALNAIPDPQRRAAMRDGDWDATAGQFFCFDEATQILTDSGWKSFPDVSTGEYVATLSPNGEMSFMPCSGVQHFDFDGELFTHDSKTGFNFAVTPRHRFYGHNWRHKGAANSMCRVEDIPAEFVIPIGADSWLPHNLTKPEITIDVSSLPMVDVGADNIRSGFCRTCDSPVSVPRLGMCDNCYRPWIRAGRPADMNAFRLHRLYPGLRNVNNLSYTFDTADWFELVGWYLTEGCVDYNTLANGRTPRGIAISQYEKANPEKVLRIRDLLTRMGIGFYYAGESFRCSSVLLAIYFEQFGKSRNKYVPREIVNSETQYLERFFEAAMMGDGCPVNDGGFIYASTSKQLIDDMQEVAIRLGYAATHGKKPRPKTKEHHNDAWQLSIASKSHSTKMLKSSRIEKTQYKGIVHCVTVDPHSTILVRREGKPMWSGNTQWNRARHVIPKEDTFLIPVDWQRYAGVDYGIHDAWAVIWIALDNNSRMWAYREYCLSDVMAQQQAQLILAAEKDAKEDSVVHVADPSMWGQRGTPYSIADIYGLEGVGLLKANNDRVVGWSLCHQRLNEGPICEYHAHKKELGLWNEDTCPMFHIFEAACPKFIETVPSLPRDDIRPDDAKTRNVEDHMADAWRYVNMYAGNFARPLIYDDYTPPTAQQILERMNDRPTADHSQAMRFGLSSEDFHFPADLNNPSSRGGW
jgi:hypothetical protein